MLPKKDTSRVTQGQITQLLVPLHKRRGRKLALSIDLPFPSNAPAAIKRKNIIKEALKVKVYMNEHPESSYSTVAYEFKVSRARICQLMKIIDTLPGDFIEEIKNCEDD